MPRDSNGNYSLPGGTIVNIGDTVLPSQHNPAFSDVAASLTNSLDRGGTGGMLADLNLGGFSIQNILNLTTSGLGTFSGGVVAINSNGRVAISSTPGDGNLINSSNQVNSSYTPLTYIASQHVYRIGLSVVGQWDVSGNWLVGKSVANGAIQGAQMNASGVVLGTVTNGFALYGNRLGSDGSVARFDREGAQVGSITVTATGTTYNTSSDERLKENFGPPADFGSVLDQIEIISYDWKGAGGHVRWGIRAQREYQNIPEVIKTGTTGDDLSDPWAWSGTPLIAGMILEMQLLRNRVKQLEGNI